MKLLKTISITVLLICFTINIQAQQKQSYAEKSAFEKTEYVANEMNLNKDQKIFLHEMLLNKIETTAEKINGKDLSEEETKTIFDLMKAFNESNKK